VPLLKVTVVPVVKPYPLMVMLVAVASWEFVVLEVTTGVTFPTCAAVPLLPPFVATEAVRFPAVRVPLKPTVKVVAVAFVTVTVPAKPMVKVTTLFAAVVEKPEPWMVRVVALAARLVVLEVIAGPTVRTPTELVLAVKLTLPL